MGRESLVMGLAVTMSLAIMGWIIWTQVPMPAPDPTSGEAVPPVETAQLTPVDEALVAELVAQAEADPADAASRTALAGLYFEAQRFEEAISWYEQVMTLSPDDVESSTSLGVSYYYSGSPERAIEQFDRSLEIAPTHAQTLLNLGIVRAFGLQDLAGAIQAWERVLEVAPDGPEATAARDALDRLSAAHESSGAGG